MSSSVATNILDFIKPKLNKRSVAFMLCLFLASLFWLLTSLSKEYVDEVVIPVAYENVPEDYLIANKPTTEVTAFVKGFGFDLLWHWFNSEEQKISVVANPSVLPEVTKGGVTYSYIVTSDNTKGGTKSSQDQFEIESISPDTLFLKFIPKYTKKVPIKLAAEISFSKQFGMVTNPILVPDSVFVSGPKTEIDTISAVYTEPQSWQNLDESVTAELALNEFPLASLIQLSQTEVKAEINVVEFTEGLVTVPVRVITDNPNVVKVFPNEVDVKYLVPLADYDNVRADQFQVSVHLNDQNALANSLPVTIDSSPLQVKNVRAVPPQVEYIIQK